MIQTAAILINLGVNEIILIFFPKIMSIEIILLFIVAVQGN